MSANNKKVNTKTKNLTDDEKLLEESYKKMTQHQHVLARPDTYIGSTDMLKSPQYIIKEIVMMIMITMIIMMIIVIMMILTMKMRMILKQC